MKIGQRTTSRSGVTALFAAAVVSRGFRDLLLRDPKAALEHGYLGERFSLSYEERNLLISIRAESLADLARQIARPSRRTTD